jgi:pimeloyl-ACP methyl ester carboxylesterase
MSNDSACVVLVHGGAHGSWCWELLVARLDDQGVRTRTVELPLRTLSEDADVVRAAVHDAKDSGPVVLAGHSYAGLVISAGGHEADELVYVAAVLPDAGDSGMSITGNMGTPELARAMEFSVDGSSVTLNEHAAAAFYGRCSEEVARDAMARLRPQGVGTMTEEVADPAWQTVSASYVICLHDCAVNQAYQQASAERLGRSVRLDADHSAFYSATDALAERLAELAEAAGTPPPQGIGTST